MFLSVRDKKMCWHTHRGATIYR